MLKFNRNFYDDNYLMIDVKSDLCSFVTDENLNIPCDVKKEAMFIYSDWFSYEENLMYEKEKIINHKIAIRCDSNLGGYLLSNFDNVNIINDDLNVSYEKVVSALDIAIFEDKCKLVNKIMPLFKGRVSGFKGELIGKYDEAVLDYILNNPDYKMYLEKMDYECKEFIVYEDGFYSKKTLGKTNNKVMQKKLIY